MFSLFFGLGRAGTGDVPNLIRFFFRAGRFHLVRSCFDHRLLSSFRTGSLSFAKIAELPPVPAKIVKAEKKTGACSQFSEAYPIFCKDSQSRVSHQIIRTLAAGSARTGSSRSKFARTGDSFEYIGGSVFRLPPSDFPVNIVKICRSRSRSALLSCELTIS